MFVVMICPECAPIVKVGGLGDVIHGLSRELEIRGHAVEIILPKYDCLRYDRIWGLARTYQDLRVPFHDQQIHCDVFFGFVDGLKCFFIEAHSGQNFFNRGTVYGNGDDPERFAFFSRAALEFMRCTNKHPEVIHCHDWHTALVPVLLYEVFEPLGMNYARVCLTVHNVGHQGRCGDHVLRQVGLDPARLLTADRLADDHDPGTVNLLKGGVVFSNFVITVSPRYAWEIMHTPLGMGLQRTLQTHGGKSGAVLNGVDYNVWNPEVDPHLPQRYDINHLDAKYASKRELRRRLGLCDAFKPVVAVVGRLDPQKGMELIKEAMPYCLGHGCQFVLLGSSSQPQIAYEFDELKRRVDGHPDCRLQLHYEEDLAHLIFAGSDLLFVPSIYEPCGLTQMIAMKYGTVPVVRNTGGLTDTVFDIHYSSRPLSERNGFVFNDADFGGVESALRRAIGLWNHYPHEFRRLMENGMLSDHSWNRPGRDYVNIYNRIRNN